MTIKKWCNVATVTVMSLTMLSVNSSKKQDLSSQAFHQTTVWSKSLKSQKTNSLLLANTTQNCQAVQTAQKDFTQPSSQRQLKTTIANENQGWAISVQPLDYNSNNYMTQWLIGIFVRFPSSKDDLINCAGVGRRTLFN